MSKQTELLAEKRTHLAEKRTELARERTWMAYIRTGTTVILFGLAFIGFSKENMFLFYSGVGAIIVGFIMIINAMQRTVRHTHEIEKIKSFFGRLIRYRFKK